MYSMSVGRPYLDYRRFLKKRYGEILHRIPLDLGLGCPNRHPETQAGGCVYCDIDGSRATHLRTGMPLRQQVEAGLQIVRRRTRNGGLMAYCQAFTSTFTTPARLRSMLSEILNAAPFRALTVGTRPDCLPDAIVAVLEEFTEQADIWVEVGIQSANDETLRRMRRGHDVDCSRRAVQTLAAHGIHTAAHVILGLPGETKKDFRHTADELTQLPLEGIKIHNLHVVKGTALAKEWRKGNVPTWDEHEYGELLIDFIRRIPDRWPIMRMVSDTAPDRLLAPRWWMSKNEFVTYVGKQMTSRGIRQGDLLAGDVAETSDKSAPGASSKESCVEADANWGQTSRALAQSAAPASLGRGDVVRVLDLGFGIGLTALALAEQAVCRGWTLHAMCLAFSPRHMPALAPAHPWNGRLQALLTNRALADRNLRIELRFGDPRTEIPTLTGPFDAIIVEPRYIDRHVQLFSVDFWRAVSPLLAEQGAIVSPVVSNRFRGALAACGLVLGTCGSPILRRGGTMAARNRRRLNAALNEKDRRILAGSKTVRPYNDPQLNWSRRRILASR